MPQLQTHVLRSRRLGRDGVVLTIAAHQPHAVLPFQFHMLSVPEDPAFPFLPRPFSVYDARPGELDFLLKEVGPGTRSLARLRPGDALTSAGPLGLGIDALPTAARTVAVAGGVGIAPFLLLFRRWLDGTVSGGRDRHGRPPLLLYGARSADLLFDLDLFTGLPIEVRTCTEDGSHGVPGRVDGLLATALAEGQSDVLCCGPDPMMEAVAHRCAEHATPCRLSLETFMACGYGVCNACAVKVADPRYKNGFRYDRCCVDGPVFDAAAIVLA